MTEGLKVATEFISNLCWPELPEGVRRRARLCLLDNLAVTLVGTMAPVSLIAAEYARESWSGNTSTIIAGCGKASAAGAAFANGCAANALDLDDDAIFARGHPGAQLFPAVLAAGEKNGVSGKQLLEALVIGYEVSIRAGRCWHDHHQVYQACGSWGSVGCAAAVAKLLNLNSRQIEQALGIAEYLAPNAPMMRDIASPSMLKHAIGWGAMTGVTSAELASCGYTGMPSILGFEKYREWVGDLGKEYWMKDWVFYKEWASCAWGHAAGVAALQLIDQFNINPDQISRVKVKTFSEAAELQQTYPATTEEAQFSLKWPLACLIMDRELGPDQILEERFSDPSLLKLFDKIEVVLDPEIDNLYNEMKEMDLRMHSAVEITLINGNHYDSGIVERKADQWDEVSLENKFRCLASYVLESNAVEDLVEMIWGFDNLTDIRELTRFFEKYLPG